MNEMPSNRFYHFLLYKCRTIGTCREFIGPEWAKRAYEKLKGYFVLI